MWVQESVHKILGCMLGSVYRRVCWEGCFGREEFNGVRDAGVICFGNVYLVASVVFKSGEDVPSRDAMGCPGGTIGGFGMGDDFGARRCHGGFVVIVASVELAPGR